MFWQRTIIITLVAVLYIFSAASGYKIENRRTDKKVEQARLFIALFDKDGDRRLSYGDMLGYYKRMGKPPPNILREYFEAVDSNNDGYHDLNELVATLRRPAEVFHKLYMKYFKLCNPNKNESLDEHEFSTCFYPKFLGNEVKPEQSKISEHFRRADKDNNGVLTWNEVSQTSVSND